MKNGLQMIKVKFLKGYHPFKKGEEGTVAKALVDQYPQHFEVLEDDKDTAELEKENADLKKQVEELEKRVAELEGNDAKDEKKEEKSDNKKNK